MSINANYIGNMSNGANLGKPMPTYDPSELIENNFKLPEQFSVHETSSMFIGSEYVGLVFDFNEEGTLTGSHAYKWYGYSEHADWDVQYWFDTDGDNVIDGYSCSFAINETETYHIQENKDTWVMRTDKPGGYSEKITIDKASNTQKSETIFMQYNPDIALIQTDNESDGVIDSTSLNEDYYLDQDMLFDI